jgi:hypothetical protein
MPKIHFTSNPKIPNDKVDEWKDYLKDSVHDVSSTEAERWLRRGVAEVITTRAANLLVKEEKEKEAEIEAKSEKVEIKAEEVKAEEIVDTFEAKNEVLHTPVSTSPLSRSIPRRS